jgi:TetR/AcrR family transcriptional repressor of nem operon
MSDRKSEIVNAAAGLMCRQGFQQTSIDDVIREAGLSGKAHFYHHFKSKEELGYAVLARAFEQFVEHGLAIMRDPMIDPLQRLNGFIDTVVLAQAARRCQGGCPFANLATELSDSHEGFRQRLETVFERWAAQIESLLWEVRPRLKDGVDTGRLARFIIATLEGALLMSRVKREIGVIEGIAEDLKQFVATHVREEAAVPQLA